MSSYHTLKTNLALSKSRFKDKPLETQEHHKQLRPCYHHKAHKQTSSNTPFKRDGFQEELLETQQHYSQPCPC